MEFTVVLKKLKAENQLPVGYSIIQNNQPFFLNALIGKYLSISFTGNIYCLGCQKNIPKSYGQGYCYHCFTTLPENEECVLKPELCKAHLGIARDIEYARANCLIEHYVYLSITSELKVGVTRHHQIPARWIDQGAIAAIKLSKTENRYQAGMIEVYLKKYISDKTNWKSMLRDIPAEENLLNEKERIKKVIPAEWQKYNCDDDEITKIQYPVKALPQNPLNISFDKKNTIKGELIGIKGQYLIFDSQEVINIRKHSGYEVVFKY